MHCKNLLQKCRMLLMILCTTPAGAQDTMRITLPQAQSQFFNQNFDLIAERYNIDIAKAEVIQSALFNNPEISFTGNIHNPEAGKYFDLSNSTGDYSFGIQQLITLAGKRNKQIKIAETNTRLAQSSFAELVRSLLYTLRSDFYNLYYLQQSLNAYKMQITSLQKLSDTYSKLQLQGTVTLKDAIRIKSLLFSSTAEQTELLNQIQDVQTELQILLHLPDKYIIAGFEKDLRRYLPLKNITVESLTDSAFMNRPDLVSAKEAITLNEQTYVYQKSLATPDLTLGAVYDRRGGFVPNASYFNAGIAIPLFNRNQGNIKASRIAIEQTKTAYTNTRFRITKEVQSAYSKALITDKMLQSIDLNFYNDFEKLLQSIMENFEKKNISLVEFSDFYDSYKTNVLQLNQLQNQKMQAIENINFTIGKFLFD